MIKLLAQPYFEDEIGFVSQQQLRFIGNQFNSELYLLVKNFEKIDKKQIDEVILNYLKGINENSYEAQALELLNLIIAKIKGHSEETILTNLKKEIKLASFEETINETELINMCLNRIFDISDLQETLTRLNLEVERLEQIAYDDGHELAPEAEQRVTDLVENDIYELEYFINKLDNPLEDDFIFQYHADYLNGVKIKDNLQEQEDNEIIFDVDYESEFYEANLIDVLSKYIKQYSTTYMKERDNNFSEVLNTLLFAIAKTKFWHNADKNIRQQIVNIIKLYATSEYMSVFINFNMTGQVVSNASGSRYA